MERTIVIFGLTLALAACGSGSATSDGGGDHAGAGGGHGGAGGGAGGGPTDGGGACSSAEGIGGVSVGTMSWTYNGSPECAYLVEPSRTTSSAIDFLDLNAVTMDSQHAIDLIVSTTSGTLVSGMAYSCAANPLSGLDVMLEINGPSGGGFSQDCTITVNQPGTATEHAQGTFSGTASGDAGTGTISNGVFDIIVMPTGG
jgi:hypothetical protein